MEMVSDDSHRRRARVGLASDFPHLRIDLGNIELAVERGVCLADMQLDVLVGVEVEAKRRGLH